MKNMKIVRSFLFPVFLLLLAGKSMGQLTVPSYSACPNQTVLVTPTWNNISNISYFLTAPGQAPVQVQPTFTIMQGVPGVYTYTLTGNGTSNTGPVTNSVNLMLTVNVAPPLSFTNTTNFCFGTSASFTTTIGGANYQVTGGCAGNMNSTSNIINIQNLTSSCAGIYTVNTTINGCARTGTTQVNVAPNSVLTVMSPTAICQYGSVQLTAALTNGTDYQWIDQGNNPLGQAGPNIGLSNMNPSQSGVYTATANIFYNNIIKCPVSATTSILVVGTSPVTASASPANIICQSTPLNLNAIAPQATGWSWFGPQAFFSTSQNPVILQALPSQNGNYSVTAIFTGGSAVCTTSAVVNVSVVPVTQPVISSPAQVCQKTNVTMSVSAGSSALSYNWTGPCLPAGVGQIVNLDSVMVSCSGIYYATAKFQISTTSCVATASVALNVVPINTITVIPPAPVCMPNNVYLQASAPGANSYQWVGPNNFTNPGANATIYNPNPSYSGNYTITAYFGGGNIVCSNTNVVQVTVNPVLNFSLDPHQLVCYNTPVTITGPAGASSYTWTSSTGYTSFNKDVIFTAIQPKDAGTYTLNINYGPCITTGQVEIEVLDHITFSLTPVDKTICRGDTLLLEGAVRGGSQNYAYYWNPPVYMNSPTGNVKQVVPEGSVLYNLIVHDIACPNFTISATVSITVNEPSIPQLTLDPGRGCAPLTMRYNSRIPSGEAIVTYDFGGQEVIQKDNFDYALQKPGTYNLKVYTKNRLNGCSNTYSYPYPITVYPRSGTDFQIEPEKPTTADRVYFKPTTQYDPILRYNWQFEGGVDLLDTSTVKSVADNDTSSLKTPERLYNVAGNYRTMLITENDYGCVDTVYKVISIIDDLNIYIPNSFTPNDDGVNDVFLVKGMGINLENFDLQIIDRWGNIVFETRDINIGWDGKVRGAPARDGTYTCFVKVVGQNGEGRREITTDLTIIK